MSNDNPFLLFSLNLRRKIKNTDKRVFGKILALEYNKLIESLDGLTGASKKPNGIDRIVMQKRVDGILQENSKSKQEVNFLQQLAPVFLKYWDNVILTTSDNGFVLVTNPGTWKFKKLQKNNISSTIFIKELVDNIQYQLQTMSGTKTDYKLKKTEWKYGIEDMANTGNAETP